MTEPQQPPQYPQGSPQNPSNPQYQQPQPQGQPQQPQYPYGQQPPYQQQPQQNPSGQPYQAPQYQQQPPFQQVPYTQAQQPQFQQFPQYPPAYSPKSKLAAGLLGIFLGTFGVHNFYLGKYPIAIIQLCLTLILWVAFGLGPLAAAIWALVEAILILTSRPGSPWHRDANGYELTD